MAKSTKAKSAKSAKSAKKPTKRRRWTKTDLRDLKAGARQKTPAAKIARALKRTVGATRQQAFKMGVSLDSR